MIRTTLICTILLSGTAGNVSAQPLRNDDRRVVATVPLFEFPGNAPRTLEQWQPILLEKWYGNWRFSHFHANGDLKELTADRLSIAATELGDLQRRACDAGDVELAWRIINENPKEVWEDIYLADHARVMTDAGLWKEVLELVKNPREDYAAEINKQRKAMLEIVVRRLVAAGDMDSAMKVFATVNVDTIIQPDGTMTVDQQLRQTMAIDIANGIFHTDMDAGIEFAQRELSSTAWIKFLAQQVVAATLKDDLRTVRRLISLSDHQEVARGLCQGIAKRIVIGKADQTINRKLTDLALSLNREFSIRYICSNSVFRINSNRDGLKRMIFDRCMDAIREDGLEELELTTQTFLIRRLNELHRPEESVAFMNIVMGESLPRKIATLERAEFEAFYRRMSENYDGLGDLLGQLVQNGNLPRALRLLSEIKDEEGRLLCGMRLITHRFSHALIVKNSHLQEHVQSDAIKLLEQYEQISRNPSSLIPNESWWWEALSQTVAITRDDKIIDRNLEELRAKNAQDRVDLLLRCVAEVESLCGSDMQASVAFSGIQNKTLQLEQLLYTIISRQGAGRAMELCAQLDLDEETETDAHSNIFTTFLADTDPNGFLSYVEELATRFQDFEYEAFDGTWYAFQHRRKLDAKRLRNLCEIMPKAAYLRNILAGYCALEGDPHEALKMMHDNVRIANDGEDVFMLYQQRFVRALCDRGFVRQVVELSLTLDDAYARKEAVTHVCTWLVDHDRIEEAIEIVEKHFAIPEDRSEMLGAMTWHVENRIDVSS